jgi:hypothetical protein
MLSRSCGPRKMVGKVHRNAHRTRDRPRVSCAFRSPVFAGSGGVARVVTGGRYRTRTYDLVRVKRHLTSSHLPREVNAAVNAHAGTSQ